MDRQFEFDHELTFTNQFDANIILQSDVPDKSQTFQDLTRDEVQKIIHVFGLHNGVHKLSTFFEHNQLKYKITLERY